MSHTPTTERTRSPEVSHDPRAEELPETMESLIDGLPDLDSDDFSSIDEPNPGVFEGVRRAEISPPAEPLGNEAADDDIERSVAECDNAEQSDMTMTRHPAFGSIADLVSSSHDLSEAEDIILCEPPTAHLAMLSLRLPARSARRSIPSYRKSVAECGAVQSFKPVIPLAKSGENGDLLATAVGVESATAQAREKVLCGAESESSTSNATAAARPELPPRGEIARLGIRKSGAAPKRIGSGALVPAKLTWMPRDPFGDGSRKQQTTRFRWEVMLTTACVTAGTVMAGIFLIRSLAT